MIVPSRIPLRGSGPFSISSSGSLRLRGVSDSTHDCESDIRALGSAFRCFRLGSSACPVARGPKAAHSAFADCPTRHRARRGLPGRTHLSGCGPGPQRQHPAILASAQRTLRARARWRRSRRWQACRALSDGQRGCEACGSPARQPRRHLQARPPHRPWLPQTSASGAVRAAMPPPRGGSSHGCCPSG